MKKKDSKRNSLEKKTFFYVVIIFSMLFLFYIAITVGKTKEGEMSLFSEDFIEHAKSSLKEKGIGIKNIFETRREDILEKNTIKEEDIIIMREEGLLTEEEVEELLQINKNKTEEEEIIKEKNGSEKE
jgi:hypothetical protein